MNNLIERTHEAFKKSRTMEDPERRDRVKELLHAGLEDQANRLTRADRLQHAIESGFIQITLDEAVEQVMGESADKATYSHEYSLKKFGWANTKDEDGSRFDPVYFKKFEPKWKSFPGWFKRKKWECIAAPLAALVLPPPRGVVLLLRELQQAKSFDFFLAVAPAQLFDKPYEMDPILLGGIMNRPVPYIVYPQRGGIEYFALARWDKID